MKKIAIISVGILIALMFVISGCQKNDLIPTTNTTTTSTTTANAEWRCIQTQCNQTISGQDWAQKNCVQNGDKVECPIISKGQQILVPIEQLNLTNAKICSQYVCTEEAPIRKVAQPYVVNVTNQ